MTKAKYIPAKTEIKIIEPAKIVLELTLEQAKVLKLIIGKTTGNYYEMFQLYREMNDIKELNTIEHRYNLSKLPQINLAEIKL